MWKLNTTEESIQQACARLRMPKGVKTHISFPSLRVVQLTWQVERDADAIVVSNTVVSATHDVNRDKITIGRVRLNWEQALLEGRGNLKKKRKRLRIKNWGFARNLLPHEPALLFLWQFWQWREGKMAYE